MTDHDAQKADGLGNGVIALADRLLKLIPRLQKPIHLIAFLAVIGLILIYVIAGVPLQAILFVLAAIMLLLLFVHAPTFLVGGPVVIIVFLVGVFVCILATLCLGVYFALAHGTPPSRSTWNNSGKVPLVELITPVNAREGYNFSYASEPPASDAEETIKNLVLRTPVPIERSSFAEVFRELARLNRPCLRSEVAGTEIKLILDRKSSAFERDTDGYNICKTRPS
ncbi:MAG: hypothetical protein K2Z80_15995 [Xanthobacteraceae bacterium]|nr:hypothetical protein [Xanthobacteraceae bacterium]